VFNSCQDEIVYEYLENIKPPIADAGVPISIILPTSFDTLRGKDSSFNGPITGRLWSLISGPNVPTIHSPSSAVTRISNLVAGVYKLQYAVIDSAGLTGVDTTSITVNGPQIQTLTLQPANSTDAHIQVNGNSDYSNATATEFSAGQWTHTGNPMTVRGLIKFDFSAIPTNATIISAKLTLYSNPTPINGDGINANSGSANAFYVGRNTSNWSVPATWFTQPTMDLSTAILVPHTSTNFLDITDLNVTSLVQTMISTNNYGFKIQLQNEVAYNIRNFCSSRYSNAAKHPKIVITYQ